MSAKYHYVAGTGGVGKGILFKLQGDHDLGRNESRLGELTGDTDYCKLHIILTYVAAFSVAGIPIYAVSRVGDDPVGRELLACMEKTGIGTEFMGLSGQESTMYSVCYQFPGGEGGNITAANGANNSVCEADIQAFFRQAPLERTGGRGMVLAAPEVPMAARLCLLAEGRKHGCFNVASVLSGEVGDFAKGGGFALTDLLAVNEDEAAAIAAFAGSGKDADSALACYGYVKTQNPHAAVAVTCGKNGSYAFHEGRCHHAGAIAVRAKNTAGAGDCYLGTMMACLLQGLPIMPEAAEKGVLSSAQEISTLAAALKVQCGDTIDFSLCPASIFRFAKEKGLRFSPQAEALFKE